MITAYEISKWFLSKSSMTHKKLQKLCYYAQAWYCALYDGTPLFKDEIQAWVHGPVIPSIYHYYADYKWLDIEKIDYNFIFSEKVINVLNAVYNTYGELSGDQLESLTHNESPWIEARGKAKPWEPSTNIITTNSMREYYRKIYETNQCD